MAGKSKVDRKPLLADPAKGLGHLERCSGPPLPRSFAMSRAYVAVRCYMRADVDRQVPHYDVGPMVAPTRSKWSKPT